MASNYTYKSPHSEKHRSGRAQWLRAAVLGVNDGIVSTSSLMLGVLAASHNSSAILTAGVAGLVAGALSMAAGEYVSVSSQRDSEKADIAIEKKSISENPAEELNELAWIYEQRGLDKELARTVAQQLSAHDAVATHARDELGIEYHAMANPIQAAVASAIAFSLGASIPIIAALLSTAYAGALAITITSLVALAISGAAGAYIGGGGKVRASLRVFVGGGLAMAATYSIGLLIGGGL
jgi:vacuolar iron transporter family protein